MGRKSKAGQNDTATIATKISKDNKEKLRCIAAVFGMNIYQLLQSVILLLLRNFDKQSDVSDEHETLIYSYLSLIASTNKCFMSNRNNNTIKKAIFFVVKNKDNSPQMISIGVNKNGKLTESYNYNEILSDVLSSIDTRLIEDLTDENRINRNLNIVDTLRNMVLSKRPTIEQRMHEEIANLFKDEIEEMFDDMAPETFEEINDVFYRRKHNKKVDGGECYTREAAKKGWNKHIEHELNN